MRVAAQDLSSAVRAEAIAALSRILAARAPETMASDDEAEG
jgi:hypothetical protein